MKKKDITIFKIFSYGFIPVVIVLALAQHRQLQDWLNSFAEILLAFWLLTAFWMGIKLIFSARFREELFARIFKTGHQDEREAFVSAHSAHKAHLFTMAILCILLFFSVSMLLPSVIPW